MITATTSPADAITIFECAFLGLLIGGLSCVAFAREFAILREWIVGLWIKGVCK